jgi:hypothetical protein
MSSKRKEYKVDDRAKKTALLFLACEANPDTRLSIPAAMRAKGYSDVKAVDQILVQQVRRESQKNKPKGTPCPESAAASLLLALATVATTARPALRMISLNQMAAPVVTVSGINAGILPSPERKVRKTLHQKQIGKQNKRKRKVIHAQAHVRATTLVAKERAMPKEVHQTRAAKKQGAGGSALVEGCACVDDGERCKPTHPLPTIHRGRRGGGGHPGLVDGNQQSGAH